MALVLTFLSAFYFFSHWDHVDNSLPIWFSKSDPDFKRYENLIEEFGTDRFVLVGVSLPVFKTESLNTLDLLTKRFEGMDGVEEVVSLANIKQWKRTDDVIEISTALERPFDPEKIGLFKAWVQNDPRINGRLVSRDGHHAFLLLRVTSPHLAAENKRLTEKIQQILAETTTAPTHLAGSPITDHAFNQKVLRDQRLFFPLTIAITIILLGLFFRNPWMVMVAALSQCSVVFWILALYFKLGATLNILGGMVFPILVCVCIANTIHLLLEYEEGIRRQLPKESAIKEACQKISRPCLFTTLTTIAGFLSFATSAIPPLKTLGILTAIGVLVTYTVNFILSPALLSILPKPARSTPPRLQGILNLVLKISHHPKQVLFIFLILTLGSIFGLSYLKVETNFDEYFLSRDPVRKDLAYFDTQLIGSTPFEILFKSDKEMALDPQVLKSLDSFQHQILSDPDNRIGISVIDWILPIQEALGISGFPDSRKEIAELVLLAESNNLNLSAWKSADNKRLRLSIRSLGMSSEKMAAHLSKILKEAKLRFNPLGINVSLTGYGPLWVKLDQTLLKSQFQSFIFAFGLVALMMMILLKDFYLGLLSLIPNIIPLLMTFGMMGFLGIHLNVATVMIAAITMGLVVDDTIYFLTRYQKNCRGTGPREALEKTILQMDTKLIFTNLILIGGFGVLTFGSFSPTIYFGSMVCVALICALISDLLLLPALMQIRGYAGSSLPSPDSGSTPQP